MRWAREKAHVVVEIGKRDSASKGFEVLRRRTDFAWDVKNRRFVRDYEQLTGVAETLMHVVDPARE